MAALRCSACKGTGKLPEYYGDVCDDCKGRCYIEHPAPRLWFLGIPETYRHLGYIYIPASVGVSKTVRHRLNTFGKLFAENSHHIAWKFTDAGHNWYREAVNFLIRQGYEIT